MIGEGIFLTGDIRKIDYEGPEKIRLQGVDAEQVFLVDIENIPQYSGGPVLNHKGEAIGIFKGLTRDADNSNKNLKAVVHSKYLMSLQAKMAKEDQDRFLKPLSMKGVSGTHLTWGDNYYEFTLFNHRNDTINGLNCLIIFKDEKGEIICVDPFVWGGFMFAGDGGRVSRDFFSNTTAPLYDKFMIKFGT